MGQWIFGAATGSWQNNVITVTPSVEILLKIGSISTTFDGSTFPESRYNASYTVNTGKVIVTGSASKTLHQSTYSEAVYKKLLKKEGTLKRALKY